MAQGRVKAQNQKKVIRQRNRHIRTCKGRRRGEKEPGRGDSSRIHQHLEVGRGLPKVSGSSLVALEIKRKYKEGKTPF